MGIRVNGPQVVSFLEWLSRNAEEEKTLRGISDDTMLRYAHKFRDELTIVERGYDFNDEDIVHAVRYGPPRSWMDVFRKSSREYDLDLLERYRRVPFHGLLLYTSQDSSIRGYLARHWEAWSEESGDLLDFYDYSIRTQSPQAYSFSHAFLSTLSPIPGARADAIYATGLPCMLVWSKADHFLIPFSDVSEDINAIRDRFRYVLQCLSAQRLDELRYRFQSPAEDEPELTDVFLSYKHDDRELVAQLHRSLEVDGFNVWHDENLRAGERFDLRIRHVLAAAKAIIVVWSATAIRSQWVLAEALFAHSCQRLVPITRRTGLQLPPPFNALQTEDFTNWPSEAAASYSRLLGRLHDLGCNS